jgi:hypothetical protein
MVKASNQLQGPRGPLGSAKPQLARPLGSPMLK